ncbi:(2Fe-2S)-binding protein [Planosporangium sp. 12N6]|uniref:(2Fe-2S)-binding protein n=1 Tax=Planosporangium spinosum TaxID=3402278 RepID=UPI003CEA1B37
MSAGDLPPSAAGGAVPPAAGDRLKSVAAGDVAAAVRRAAGTNPLLAIGLDRDAGAPASGLRAAGAGVDDVAADLVDRVAARLGTGERRVAASMVVLGYAARLVGPAVAALLREDLLLDLRPENVRFAYDPPGGFTVVLVRWAGWRGDRSALRRRWCETVVDDHLGLLVNAVRARVPVAAPLLWGNVASGLAGALRAVASGGTVAHSATPARCYADGRYLLNHGPLRGSGDLTLDDGQLRFVRRSCCLYYRLDGGGMCGDCVLLHRRR